MKNQKPDAKTIAANIHTNCRAYHVGTKSYEDWTAEQQRLWSLARNLGLDEQVSRIIHDVGADY